MLNVCQESNLRVPPPPRDADTLWTQLVIARELCTFVCSFVPPTPDLLPPTSDPGSPRIRLFIAVRGPWGRCWEYEEYEEYVQSMLLAIQVKRTKDPLRG